MRAPLKYNPLEQLSKFYGFGDDSNAGGMDGNSSGDTGSGSGANGEGGSNDNNNTGDIGGTGPSGGYNQNASPDANEYGTPASAPEGSIFGGSTDINDYNGFGELRGIGENTPLGQEQTDFDTQNAGFNGFGTETEAADQAGYSIEGIMAFNGVYSYSSYYNPNTGVSVVDHVNALGIAVDTHIAAWADKELGIGDTFGFVEEIAADTLEALDFEVNELNVDIAIGIAKIAISLIIGAPIAAVALQAADVAADVAYANGAISADTYNNVKATIAIAGVVYGVYTSMQAISVISQYNSALSFAVFAVTAYTVFSTFQSIADKYGLDMEALGAIEDLGIDGDGGGYSSLNISRNDTNSITTLVSSSANYMGSYNTASKQLNNSIYDTTVDYSKEEAEMQSSYTDFRGGLNNITAPHLLRKNEGQVYTNIDLSSGTMKSLNGDTIIQELTDNYFIKTRLIGDTEKHLVSSTDYRHYAKMNGFLFFTSDTDGFQMVRYKDAAITISDATIPKPTVAPTVEAIGVDEINTEMQTEYNYCYTYYSTESGFESDPIYSDLWFATTQSIKINNMAGIDNEFVDKIRLYRIGGYTTIYRLVAELDNPGYGLTATYDDQLHGTTLSFNLDTYLSGDVIEGLTGLTENRGTFFAYKDNRMYFTSPGKPNSWNAFNYLRFNDTISGLAVTPIGILVFTDNPSVYIVGGLNKNNFSSAILSKSINCVSYKSVQNIKNASIWLASQGLMMSLGASVQNITKSRVNVSALGDVYSSLVNGDVYYCICENGILTADFSYTTPSFKIVSRDNLTQLQLDGTNLIGANGTNLLDIYNDADNLRTLEYHSPLLINQHYDTIKAFSKVSVSYIGSFAFKVYLDGVLVVDHEEESLVTSSVAELNLPAGKQEGKGLSVHIVGEGEIFNIREIYNLQNLN